MDTYEIGLLKKQVAVIMQQKKELYKVPYKDYERINALNLEIEQLETKIKRFDQSYKRRFNIKNRDVICGDYSKQVVSNTVVVNNNNIVVNVAVQREHKATQTIKEDFQEIEEPEHMDYTDGLEILTNRELGDLILHIRALQMIRASKK